MQLLSNDTLKLVTVRPSRPFRIGHASFTSIANKIPLSVATINYCLQEKAFVVEHLAGGKEVQLDFTNYNTDNGPTALGKDATEYVRGKKRQNHEIEMVGADRERTILNKAPEKQLPIIHIDLEEEKRKEAARKAEEEKARKAEEARKAAAAAKAAKEEQKRLDEAERQKAIDAIIAREQAKASEAQKAEQPKVVSNSTPAQIEDSLKTEEMAQEASTSYEPNFAIPVEAKVDIEGQATVEEEPKSDFTISGRQDNKKTKFDHKRK